MDKKLLLWDVYEINAKSSSLNGVMLRGRIRKFALERQINLLAENTADKNNAVRFAVYQNQSIEDLAEYLNTIIPDASIKQVLTDIPNPVLSKLNVNKEGRYIL